MKDEKDLKYKEAINQSVKALAEGQFSLDKVCPTDEVLKLVTVTKDKSTGKEIKSTKEYRIKAFSLLAKKYFIRKYGLKEFVIYLNETPEIMGAEIVYHLSDAELKKDYPSDDDFLNAFPYAGGNMNEIMRVFNGIMGFAGQSGATEAEQLEADTDDGKGGQDSKKK